MFFFLIIFNWLCFFFGNFFFGFFNIYFCMGMMLNYFLDDSINSVEIFFLSIVCFLVVVCFGLVVYKLNEDDNKFKF